MRRLQFSLLFFITLLSPAVLFGLSRDEALEILGRQVLFPSSSNEPIMARMVPEPLTGGIVEPVSGGAPTIDVATISGNPQWFAMVDLAPCALFEHDVVYVFIDDVTGAVAIFLASNWPSIDGIPLGQDTTPGARVILIFSMLPRPSPVAAGSPTTEPFADYGDAPEDQPAYLGVTGTFPTFFATLNSVFGRPGAHALTTGLETLGRDVSVEQDVVDPADPDGVTNLRDADRDERMFVTWDPNTTPATSHLIYDVSVSSGAPDVARFVNVLFDFDRSGNWSGAAAGSEWAVVNQTVDVAPGTTATTLITPPFFWGDTMTIPTQVWARVTLSRSPIPADIFGAAGWDGSGVFEFGEVEDFEFYLRECPPAAPAPVFPPPDDPPPPPPAPPPPGRKNPPPGPGAPFPPGPALGWNGEPVRYRALVIQGPDNPGQTIVDEAADTMEALLNARGYATTRLSGGDANADNIRNRVSQIRDDIVCQDRVLIYFIAHGFRNTPGGRIQLATETLVGAQLADILRTIPPCPDQQCDRPNRSCDVTVLMESCFSGQWGGALDGVGRRIITTSSASQFSWGGSDGSGGEYSDEYARCTLERAADTNNDGVVDPTEAHQCASGRLNTPQLQTPGISDRTCDCICPVDQLHVVGPVPNRLPVGMESSITASVQANFVGVPGQAVVFTTLLGGIDYTSGTVSPDGRQATLTTDVDGLAVMTIRGASPGLTLVKVTVTNTALSAFALLFVVP